MRKLASLVLMLVMAARIVGQSNDAQLALRWMQQPSNDSLVPFCNTLFSTGRITAASLLLKSSETEQAAALKQTIAAYLHGETFVPSAEFTTAEKEFQQLVDRVKATKNKKLKKAILDSLLATTPSTSAEKIAHMNACVKISMLLYNKKSAEQSIVKAITEIPSEKALVIQYFLIEQTIRACEFSKNGKLLPELKIVKEKVTREIQATDEAFLSELLQTSSVKTTPEPAALPPAEEPATNYSLIIAGSAISIIVLLSIYFSVRISKRNKTIASLKTEIADSLTRSNQEADVQSQSIRHHEIQLSETRKKITSLKTTQEAQRKQFEENINHIESHITDFQNEIKLSADQLSRDNSVQSRMEFNNQITRNSQKLRDLFKSLRNSS